MKSLPTKYEYLYYEPGPKMLLEMLNLHGVEELLGPGDNPLIMAWAKEVKAKGYTHDAVAWCGLGMAVAAKRGGWDYEPGGNSLWARNWAKWGTKQKVAMLGDVLVFPRGTGGHVAIYVGEDKSHYHILGANQTDKVNIARKPKEPIIAIRRAPWKIKQPPGVRQIFVGASGQMASKES